MLFFIKQTKKSTVVIVKRSVEWGSTYRSMDAVVTPWQIFSEPTSSKTLENSVPIIP